MKGWYRENYRHSLAARGIRTSLWSKRQSLMIERPLKKSEIWAYLKSVEDSGLIVDRGITGEALARKFGIPAMGGRQLVDQYLEEKREKISFVGKSEAERIKEVNRLLKKDFPKAELTMTSRIGEAPEEPLVPDWLRWDIVRQDISAFGKPQRVRVFEKVPVGAHLYEDPEIIRIVRQDEEARKKEEKKKRRDEAELDFVEE